MSNSAHSEKTFDVIFVINIQMNGGSVSVWPVRGHNCNCGSPQDTYLNCLDGKGMGGIGLDLPVKRGDYEIKQELPLRGTRGSNSTQ